MSQPDQLRFTRFPLANGAGTMPALGFGTLIPDPVATRSATKAALEAGFRALDTAGEEVTMWGETERHLEGSRKVRCGDTAHASELVYRPWTLRIAVHGIFGSKKPSQQCRVLARRILRHPYDGVIVSDARQLRWRVDDRTAE